jgi:hypothetical protein
MLHRDRPRMLAVLVVLGCTPPVAAAPTEPTAPEPSVAVSAPAPASADPGAQISELEQRLLAAQRVQLTFEVSAHGVVEAELRGLLIVEPGKLARIDASGRFAGAKGEVSLAADARMVRGRSGERRFEIERPAELDTALLLGLVRMGVLHNLALLWAARPPDHGDGGMQQWVITTDHHAAEIGGLAAVGFGVTVDGQPIGEAILQLDDAGWPVQREQTVRFPNGEMKVTERYEAVEITDAP